MSRKACKRRHYPLVNPIALAIEGAAITADSILDRMRLLELSAIEAFRTGRATVDDWRALADMGNVAQTMAAMGIGHEALPTIEAMEAHLADAHARHQRTGRVGLTGAGLQTARDLQEYHDLQRTSVARSVYEKAINDTEKRIRGAHPSVKRVIGREEIRAS